MTAEGTKVKALTIAGSEWRDKIVIICGNGLSALTVNWASLQHRPELVVCVTNGGFRTVPWAHVLMLSDRNFLGEVDDLAKFAGEEMVVTAPNALRAVRKADPRMRWINRAYVEHLGNADPFADKAVLVEGHNSITTLMSLSVLRGARKILLIGIDLMPGTGNKRRATDNLVDDPVAARQRYEKQQRHFDMFAPWLQRHGVKVLNGNPESYLKSWPKTRFLDGLAEFGAPLAG